MTEETPLTYFNTQSFCITSVNPGLIPFLCGGPVAEGTRVTTGNFTCLFDKGTVSVFLDELPASSRACNLVTQ